jgi:hypothetical protein
MKRRQKQSGNAAPRLRVMAGLLLGLFVFVLAMAEFGALHRLLHADAGQAEHHCAVTMLVGGQVDVATGEVRVAFTPAVAVAVVMPAAQIFVAVDYSLLPGRAPPAGLS